MGDTNHQQLAVRRQCGFCGEYGYHNRKTCPGNPDQPDRACCVCGGPRSYVKDRRPAMCRKCFHQSIKSDKPAPTGKHRCRNCGALGHNSKTCIGPAAPPKSCQGCGSVFVDQYRSTTRRDGRDLCIVCARAEAKRKPRPCTVCNQPFEPNRSDSRTCSEQCRRANLSRLQSRFKSLVGLRFGKWTVKQHDKADSCVVECDCGHVNVRKSDDLRNGISVQCRYCRRLEIESKAMSDEAQLRRLAYSNANSEKHDGVENSMRVFKRDTEWRRNVSLEKRDAIDRIKSAPCMDCGNTFPPVCMDFDHRPGEVKIGGISKLAKKATIATLLAEMAKCDLVCANCHRIRTHSRGHGPGGYGSGVEQRSDHNVTSSSCDKQE